MSSDEISAIRSSCRKHNGSYRRKLRKLYSENPAAGQIVEAQVADGNLTEQEFEFISIEKIRRTDEDPYLYKVAWADTENGPDAFIGNEKHFKKYIPEYRNMSDEEIRHILVKQYNHNKSLEENEDIVIPKIHKN